MLPMNIREAADEIEAAASVGALLAREPRLGVAHPLALFEETLRRGFGSGGVKAPRA
jgi:hypothetical protein